MSLRHALLGLLVEHPASGYDLLKLFEGSLANVWPASQSQIYTELTKLAADELITVSDTGPRGRKEYALTDAGRDELRRWLVDGPPERPARNPALLRVFFLGVLDQRQRAVVLDEMLDNATRDRAALEQIRDAVDWDDSDLSRYGRMALEWGLRFTAMRRDWAEWAAAQLD
ncbi:PadR family transcriptional regulator [Actinocatenispora thailandica]|uniref:PadR family transcriptional regulator n=1 Tax=Actinocatenispora thailandica TaxID=227318 RepID=A0A7R7DJ78_9ACTN|nr:PadR family transcriptional regulator [Actinocatenispora thailandica]BCJ32697.1 PadR family transcriptional regulator [Actinocatenispora thailandica]